MIIIMNKQFLLASPLPGHSDISSYLFGDNCITCKTLPATGMAIVLAIAWPGGTIVSHTILKMVL